MKLKALRRREATENKAFIPAEQDEERGEYDVSMSQEAPLFACFVLNGRLSWSSELRTIPRRSSRCGRTTV